MNIRATLYFLFITINAFSQERITISGFVKEKGSEEFLTGVNVYIPGTSINTISNNYGFYSLTVPQTDSVTVSYSMVGFEKTDRRIQASRNAEVNVFLPPAGQLKEVVVSAQKEESYVSRSVQMSKVGIPIDQIKKLPALFGEKDILKGLQLMPGVQKGTEGQTGLYVRGGGPDQNLIILDDAVVYNASHLFGFFSVFNSDAIRNVDLTKGGFPARYGVSLSSVVEMNMKEGSKDKLHGEGGIGLLASRLTLEGPLTKGKSSFLISGRRTYIDILAAPVMKSLERKSENDFKPGYYFYDLNAKVNFDLGPKDKIYLSGYFGRDKFYIHEKSSSFQSDVDMTWGNATATTRWNHILNRRLFVNTSLIFTNFYFSTGSNFKDIDQAGQIESQSSVDYQSNIRDFSLKSDFDYYPGSKHAIRFGVQATQHTSTPSAMTVTGNYSDQPFKPENKPVYSVEGGVYAEDTWQALDAFKMNAGFRLSYFRSGMQTYVQPEPRFSAALQLATDFSAKLSYAKMNQYVHLLSNTGLGLSTDLWVTSTERIRPQHSDQFAFGFAKDLEKPSLTFTLEGFYKKMNDILSYKEGATFLGIDGGNATEVDWQDNVISGKGWSYGAEFLAQKKSGRLTGWVGYTLSWINWQFPELNSGKIFHPRYDRRHDFSLIGIYELTKNITMSATWVYGTGNAITVPAASYRAIDNNFFSQYNPDEKRINTNTFGSRVPQYDAKNSFRAEAFHRLDLAVQFRKKKKRYERIWEISAYNAYNRKNPFFYDMSQDESSDQLKRYSLKKYSLFPVLPSISYNFKF